MIRNDEFSLEAVRRKLKALLAEIEAALGYGSATANTGAHTDSGGNGPPPHKPPVLDPEG